MGSKPVKPVHRGSVKRAGATHGHSHSQQPSSPTQDGHTLGDSRHKRVWKACERCRMKKTKVCVCLCVCVLCLVVLAGSVERRTS